MDFIYICRELLYFSNVYFEWYDKKNVTHDVNRAVVQTTTISWLKEGIYTEKHGRTTTTDDDVKEQQ